MAFVRLGISTAAAAMMVFLGGPLIGLPILGPVGWICLVVWAAGMCAALYGRFRLAAARPGR